MLPTVFEAENISILIFFIDLGGGGILKGERLFQLASGGAINLPTNIPLS